MRRAAAVLAAAVLATAGTFAAASASATTGSSSSVVRTSPYVALGDSYSSGAGVNPLVPNTPAICSRSGLNYAHDIAALTRPQSFTDVTCNGAKTSDFFFPQSPDVPPQLDAVTGDTRLVTMTIGGNDGHLFTTVLGACTEASAISLATTKSIEGNPCEQKYGSSFADQITGQTSGHLVDALTAVRQQAPAATVVILGYPRILPETGVPACYPVMPISMGDVPYMSHIEAVLNGVIRKAAAQTGARFVDMAPSSAGHDVCRGALQRWVEPPIAPINASPVHPNAFGEAAMAGQTLLQLVR
jgi:GDSL-like lipase/acylhydrolase family protein